MTPAYEAAVDAHLAGPHPLLVEVWCAACVAKQPDRRRHRVIGRVESSPSGPLLIAWWRSGQGLEEDVSLLEFETTPFTWRCDRHGGQDLPRSAVRSAMQTGKSLAIHREHSAPV